MFNEGIRLYKAFIKKSKNESIGKALKLSIIYIFNKKSLYSQSKSFNNKFDFLKPKEFIRLSRAYFRKTLEENIFVASKIAFFYIFDREKLNPSHYNFFYPNKDINLTPLVSLLIVSYNSQDDLIELFDSINKQTFKNLEIILVENGDKNNKNILKTLNYPYKYIDSSNVGFAAANNLAFENSKGDYICLINPDTILNENVIELLLFSLLSNNELAASVPKIIFYKKFIDIEVHSNKNFMLNLNKLSESLNYKKFFIRFGQKINKKKVQFVISQHDHIVISIPIDQSKAIFNLTKFNKYQFFYYKINGSNLNNEKIISEEISANELNLIINCDQNLIWWGKNIINNAGSALRQNGPFDRGFGEYDLDLYNQSSYIQALCGCVAMISPKVFAKRKIFIDEFFAYYEDSELSNWILNNDYQIGYNHKAIVKHKHSASTEEGSSLWSTFVNRSKKIYDFLIMNEENIDANKFINKYEKIPANLKKVLVDYDKSLDNKNRRTLYKKFRPSVAIYNSFWNTKGGGEKHALSIAKLLSEYYDVYLLSEHDFDSDELTNYFSINFKFRKYIRAVIDSKTTTYFDLFVNSTYQSGLISLCPKSLYIVSFPSKYRNKKFLKNYFFIHNSNFTKKWAEKYWGPHKNTILYPITELKSFSNLPKFDKHELENNKRNMISIGRFSKKGHDKKQDLIVKAFNKAKELTNSDFNLFLIGSLDSSKKDDLDHYNKIESLKQKDTYIFPNLNFQELQKLLSISKIYIHATGVDKTIEKEPHLLEHFGISVIEAMLYDNYPIVFAEGGPGDIVRITKNGETFNDFNSLVDILVRVMDNFDEEKYTIKNNILQPFEDINKDSLNKLKNIYIDNENL